MTVREHLANFHKFAASHHTRMAKLHEAHLKKAAAMAEEDKEQGSANEHHNEFHRAAMAEHQTAAKFHADQEEACLKAAADGDLSKLQPTQVRGVIPSMPTMVPRAGASAPAPAPGAMPGTTKAVDSILPSLEDESFFV